SCVRAGDNKRTKLGISRTPCVIRTLLDGTPRCHEVRPEWLRSWGSLATRSISFVANLSVTQQAVTVIDDEVTEVDLGADAMLLPVERGELGPILAGEELAVDKILAVFGRAEARDFVD